MATFGFAAGTFTKLGPGFYAVDIKKGFGEARFGTSADKLVFEVFYCILSPLGSIPGDPTFGTLIPGAIGKFSVNATHELQDFILTEFQRAQAGIVARQANQGLPPEQLLQRLTAESIEIDEATSQAKVIMGLVNQAEQSFGFSIPFSLGAL